MEHDTPMFITEKRRRDAGNLHVTERDMTCLTWISEQFCIAFDQLRRLLGYYAKATTKHPDILSVSATRDALERWLQLGLIESPRKILGEHAPYIWLSRKGLTQLGLPYSYYQPKPSTIRHLYAVNTIRLHLQRFQVAAEWRARRQIRLHTEQRPLPDAELVMNDAPLIALRVVEQPRLPPLALQDELTIMQALTQSYTRLWYFVHAQAREQLQTAVRKYDDTTELPQLLEEQLQSRIVWYSLDAKEMLPE